MLTPAADLEQGLDLAGTPPLGPPVSSEVCDHCGH